MNICRKGTDSVEVVENYGIKFTPDRCECQRCENEREERMEKLQAMLVDWKARANKFKSEVRNNA